MIFRSAGLALLLLGAAFSAFAEDEKDNEQLTLELGVAQRQIVGIQQDFKEIRRLLDNRGMLELLQRVDELADEMSHLRGLLEQQDHDLQSIKKRQRELYLDVDRRLRELELSGGARQPAAAAPELPDPAETQPAQPAQAEEPAPSAPSVTTPASVVTPVPKLPTPASGGSRSTTVSEERGEYQEAFDMLKEGRYKMANSSFRGFLKKYPQSSYAGNAQYWLGESHYVTRQFEQAIKEFSAVVENYSESNKVPDAMLKLGYTYYELGKFAEARQVLENLKKYAPNSTAARLAGKRLERMGREGR